MSWKITVDPDGIKHVYPLDEESQHVIEDKNEMKCSCHPFVVDENIIVHNAYDGRQEREKWAELLKSQQ